MSKLLKSKFLLGLMMVVAFAVVTTSVSAAITSTLKQGSKGAEVTELQTALNVSPATGYFGTKTKAAVVAFQTSKGLKADGVVGAMTRAALSTGTTTTTTTFPAGCTSAVGFSSTTGLPCSTTTTFPAGCTSAVGYSTTTGLKCDSTTTPTTPTTLTGGAGDITVTELSSPSSSTKVGEGEKDVKVLGFEVEADDGSDVSINSMRVTLEHTSGSGNDKLNRYATDVSIFQGSTKVGSATVADFSENAGVYSKSISLSNAVVKAGKIEKFYVTVNALADIDSGNTGSSNNTWTTTLVSTRFADATGVVLTDSTTSIANTAVFDTLSNTGDVELKVNLASGTPAASTVKVSTTSDTNQVELMKFTMKAQNSKMVIDQIPVLFTTSHTMNALTTNVTLVVDGKTFNESVSAAASTATISFNDLGLEVASGATLTGTVYADVKDIDSNFTEGTTLTASITSGLVATTGSSAGALDVEDSNGDQLATGDRTGSAIGNSMTFRSSGVNTVMGTVIYGKTSDQNGVVTQLTYTIPVSVTSFGNTLYLGQSGQFATTATASNAFAVVFENSTTPTTADVTSSASIAISTSDAITETNGYRLDDGSTKHFNIEVTLNTPGLLGAVTAGNYRVRLDDIRTFTNAGLESNATATSSDLLPTSSFRTDFKYITS